jgi:hypothetical protein
MSARCASAHNIENFRIVMQEMKFNFCVCCFSVVIQKHDAGAQLSVLCKQNENNFEYECNRVFASLNWKLFLL